MVKCFPEFEYFTVFLKNKNIIFKIRRSKVTDYAALNLFYMFVLHVQLDKTYIMLARGSWMSKVLLFTFLVLLLYVPSQQLWSLRDGQFT